MKCGAIIVAAGSGKRMGGSIKKQFLKIHDKEIFILAAEKFYNMPIITQLVIVTSLEDLSATKEILKKHSLENVIVISGGKERQDSVFKGLKALNSDSDIVLIHDGVRPFISESYIEDVINKTKETGACSMAVPVKDTIKVCQDGIIKETLNRSTLWAMQTPQGFNYKAIVKAYESLNEKINVTDDASIMEEAGYKVSLVLGNYENIKITTREDLIIGEAIHKSIKGKGEVCEDN